MLITNALFNSETRLQVPGHVRRIHPHETNAQEAEVQSGRAARSDPRRLRALAASRAQGRQDHRGASAHLQQGDRSHREAKGDAAAYATTRTKIAVTATASNSCARAASQKGDKSQKAKEELRGHGFC